MAVSSAQAAMLRTRAAAAGVSFARLLMAITGRAILRAFDREALLLGVLVDLRPGAAFDATVGCFATALPLPFAAPAGATLEETARSLSAGLMRAYRSRPYPGRITVLRSSCQPLLRLRGDASLGWAALAEGGVEVRGIPGNHQSLMWAPQVAALGAVLCDVLDVPPIHRKDPRSSLPRLLPVSSARSRRRSPPNP
jgi:thioesterase domain-containing protein